MSMIRFTPVGESTEPLTVTLGLSGGSGTGKTYTAMRVARGLSEAVTGRKGTPFGFVDTENRRALHYRDAFPEMMHYDMRADVDGEIVGFGPERWIEVIDAAEAAQIPVLVIDSFSHAWEGVGGILDLQAEEVERLTRQAEERANGRYTVDPTRFSEQAWIQPKRRYRRLIDRIVRARCHMVICTRAKPVRQETKGGVTRNSRATKTRRMDVPWDVASDRDLMFELSAMIILDPEAPGHPVHQIKCADQFKTLFDVRRPMDEELGRRMGEWAKGRGNAMADKAMLDEAREAARGGKAAFVAYWKALAPDARQVVRAITGELERIAAEADRAAAQSDDDPFGLSPSAEDLARAEREAMEAIRRQQEEAA